MYEWRSSIALAAVNAISKLWERVEYNTSDKRAEYVSFAFGENLPFTWKYYDNDNPAVRSPLLVFK